MATKEQVVILATPEQLDQLDVLRIVMGVSRAEVARQGLTSGLPKLEKLNAERISRLSKVASEHGVTLRELAVAYANKYARKTYGATLEELEDGRVTLPLN